ncbi:MAG: hypothetical protein ACTSR3_16605 [Candidatus Helarchaeota archaeon]
MSIMNFRISKELREKIRAMTHINWSEELRKAIEQIIEKEEKKNQALAVLLNEQNVITPDEGWKSLDEIRKWRQTIRWQQ